MGEVSNMDEGIQLEFASNNSTLDSASNVNKRLLTQLINTKYGRPMFMGLMGMIAVFGLTGCSLDAFFDGSSTPEGTTPPSGPEVGSENNNQSEGEPNTQEITSPMEKAIEQASSLSELASLVFNRSDLYEQLEFSTPEETYLVGNVAVVRDSDKVRSLLENEDLKLQEIQPGTMVNHEHSDIQGRTTEVNFPSEYKVDINPNSRANIILKWEYDFDKKEFILKVYPLEKNEDDFFSSFPVVTEDGVKFGEQVLLLFEVPDGPKKIQFVTAAVNPGSSSSAQYGIVK